MKSTITRQIWKNVPLQLAILFTLFLVVGYICGVIVHEAFGEKDDMMDQRIFGFISTMETTRLTQLMKTITFFASAKFLPVAYFLLVLWFLLAKKNKLLALHITVIGITTFLIMAFFKRVFQRVRPLDPLIEPLENYSYPSGHASLGFVFYGLLAHLALTSNMRVTYKRIVAGSLILFSLIIGFSRIYLRIHYPSDVIAGFCLGIAWLSLSVWFLRKSNV